LIKYNTYVLYDFIVYQKFRMPNIKWKIEFDWRDKEYKWRYRWPWWDALIDVVLEELSKILQSPEWKFWHYWEFDFITDSWNVSHLDPGRWDGKVVLKIYDNADQEKIKEVLEKSAQILKLMRASEEQIAKILNWKPKN
jgi:hypothetical protein